MRINTNWQLILRYFPGVLWLFRTLVFLFLESTAVRFKVTGGGAKARNRSAEGSRAYITETAPGMFTKQGFLNRTLLTMMAWKRNIGRCSCRNMKLDAKYVYSSRPIA